MIIIDQLIFDQLSPTLTKPKRLTKSSPPLYHQKNDNTKYHLRNQKNQSQGSKFKERKKHTIFSYFPPCMINVLVFFEDIYTHETKLLVFFRYFVTIVWIGYTMIQIVLIFEQSCKHMFLEVPLNNYKLTCQFLTKRNIEE